MSMEQGALLTMSVSVESVSVSSPDIVVVVNAQRSNHLQVIVAVLLIKFASTGLNYAAHAHQAVHALLAVLSKTLPSATGQCGLSRLSRSSALLAQILSVPIIKHGRIVALHVLPHAKIQLLRLVTASAIVVASVMMVL
jgi:hypothetical protein